MACYNAKEISNLDVFLRYSDFKQAYQVTSFDYYLQLFVGVSILDGK
jgi:hypothetical protein